MTFFSFIILVFHTESLVVSDMLLFLNVYTQSLAVYTVNDRAFLLHFATDSLIDAFRANIDVYIAK